MDRESCNKDVAVIGMSCRVAGANSPSELWDLLVSSRDVQSEITRFNSGGYYHPKGGPLKGLTNVQHAYMMEDSLIDKFDNAFFHVPPNEAKAMDPQQRMLLEIAYEAVESAGVPLADFVGTDTAVFAGMDSCDYHSLLARDIDATPLYLATGTAACMAANRISYFFDLSGPSLAIDTACSSTMAALHQAVRTLQCGDASMALVCGSKLILNPDMFMPSSEMNFLSPTGRCRSFDAASDGYARGEGALALLLKPMKDAIAARDPIRAIIKGTRLNQDGRTQGITLPSAEAQKQNMRDLYNELGLSPNDIQYVEAHGTGTAAGDPLEFSAINAVFGLTERNQPLVVGSVKSNIGHTESCAALAGLVKTIECLERGQIPSQMHFTNPNPKINFQNVRIPTGLLDWPKANIRRAAVNTFGAGGTNGHAVLEHYPRASSKFCTGSRPWLYKASANDSCALKRLSRKYADYVETKLPNLHDLAYTLLSRRSNLKSSLFLTASTHGELIEKLRADNLQISEGGKPCQMNVVLIFTGQGAQWPQMGMKLLAQSSIFRNTLLDCERELATLSDKPAWSIVEELSKARGVSNIHQSEFSQPLCTALQLGLIELWKSWGLVPSAVVGHSSGEIAAAYAAGLMPLREAIIAAYYRGIYLKSSCKSSESSAKGGMCAIGLGEDGARLILDGYGDRVQLGAINSPMSCTLTGDLDAIKEIVGSCAKNGTFCRELRVDMAYHSNHMLPVGSRYEKALRDQKMSPLIKAPNCDMFSSVTGRKLMPEECSPFYWKQNMVSTVEFASAITECLNCHLDTSIVFEVGPHPTLQGPSKELLRSLGKDSVQYFHSLHRAKDDLENLLETARAMIAYGVPLQTSIINAREVTCDLQSVDDIGNVLTDIPSYQWDHSTPFWFESRTSRNIRFRQFPRHQLLGSRYVEDLPSSPSWRSLLMLREIPWLMELKVTGASDIPAAAFILMALEAARQLQPSVNPTASSTLLSDVVFDRPLQLALFKEVDTVIELHFLTYQLDTTDAFQFDIMSLKTEGRESSIRHCSGKLVLTSILVEDNGISPSTIKHDSLLLEHWESNRRGTFRNLKEIKLGSEGQSGVFESGLSNYESYAVDPLVLNSVLNLAPASVSSRILPSSFLISSIKTILAPVVHSTNTCGNFITSIGPNRLNGVQGTIGITRGDSVVSLADICYEVDRLDSNSPALKSLFFTPVAKPDISTMSPSNPISLSRCLELITHKWPMSDIGVTGVPNDDILNILTCLHGTSSHERPPSRSIHITGEANDSSSSRVRFVKDLDQTVKFHLFFAGSYSAAKDGHAQVLPNGFICVRTSKEPQEEPLGERCRFICTVKDSDSSGQWLLWQKKYNIEQQLKPHKAKIFACPRQPMSSVDCLPYAELVSLDPRVVEDSWEHDKADRFDVVIIDCHEKSIVATWPGEDIVPWLQGLLKQADSILWVTTQIAYRPYSNIAGSLLRTLQAEMPSLKVSWLILDQSETNSAKQARITSAYSGLKEGENEVRLEVKDSQVNILRYYPDDGLSTSMGLILPRVVAGSIVGKDYELSLCAPGEPVILSSNRDNFHELKDGKVRVEIEASVIDASDVLAVNGVKTIRDESGLGRFFAGRVVSKTEESFPIGSKVVGWYAGAHRNRLEVSSRCILLHKAPTPAYAAATFAATATALCVVDGVARARMGDTFRVQVDGILGEAIARFCHQSNATVVDSNTASADFTISLSILDGLLVNGSPVDIEKYLESERGSRMISEAWESRKEFRPSINIFGLADYRLAFNVAISAAYSTVLSYSDVAKVTSSVAVYTNTKKLFSISGAYVVIGGLGGLGRFVCSWMAANGAKKLVSISRNGLASKEAQEAFSAINVTGASLEVMTADACDREAISNVLGQIRKGNPIKGVINMAMLLGDAPLVDMAGWQWDRSLRLKIDSSWILHEETLNDPLEFFIMYSSIASVLGNRNQAGYNVGNTFLNALATYRHTLGLPGISIALGAMTEAGVLHELGREDLLQTLSRSGLSHLRKNDLAKIMEAAITESHCHSDRSVMVTGLEMFERIDGKLVGSQDQTQLYWTDLAEFGHLQSHSLSEATNKPDRQLSLQELIQTLNEEEARIALLETFLDFLSKLLGFATSTFNSSSPLSMCGLDSLSAVSCQYWFYKELAVNVSVADVFKATSINQLVGHAYGMVKREL